MANSKADDAKPDDELADYLEEFKLCEEGESENRLAFLDDIKFARLEEQWPEGIKKQRDTDHRPCLTINKLGTVIRQVVNDARQNKPQIKVHPADDTADPETAEIYSGLIRNIETVSKADVAYDTAVDSAVTGGFGYIRIGIDYACDDSFEQDILIKRVANPLSVYGDPFSKEADSSDWNIAFVVESLPKKVFERKYKNAEKVDWKGGEYARLEGPWMQGEQVMVAERWARDEIQRQVVALIGPEGELRIIAADVLKANPAEFDGWTVKGDRKVKSYKVTQKIISGAEVLEANDWLGRYIPIVPVYGDEVNVEGKRHFRSLIRSAKDSQRMFNYWNTAATELMALAPKAPFIGEEGAFAADPNWDTANIASHPYLEYAKGKQAPQRQMFNGIPAGDLQMAMTAADHIRATTGIHQASMGEPSNEKSGRAIMARQREGDVSTFHFIDNLTRAIRHTGAILIDLIPHVYSSERVIRVMGAEGEPSNVPLKTPVPVKDKNGAPVTDPQTGQPKTRIYDLAVGKYDLTATAGPSFTSRREEAANQMVELIRAYPAAAPLIGDLLAKNLDWPGADEIGRRLQAMLPPQIKGENPEMQAVQQQLMALQQALQKAMAETEAAKNDNSADGAKIGIDRDRLVLEERKIRVDEYNAETARFKAMNPAGAPMPEEAITALVLQTIQQLLDSPDISEGEPQPEPMEPPPMMEAPLMPPMGPMAPQPPEMGSGEPLQPPTPDQAEALGQMIEPQEE